MSKSPYQSVEEYIGSFDGVTHEKLTTLRSIIRETAPNAEEKLSWGVPTYYQNGFLVEFAMAKAHIGFYTSPNAIAHFKEELRGLCTNNKNTTQLPLDQELPVDLIRRMVLFCVEQNEAKSE